MLSTVITVTDVVSRQQLISRKIGKIGESSQNSNMVFSSVLIWQYVGTLGQQRRKYRRIISSILFNKNRRRSL